MFDDPKKELQRLQDRLLAAEAQEPVPDEDDPDAALAEVKKILARDVREKRAPQSRGRREPADKAFRAAVAPESKRKNRIAGLIIALLLEIAALAIVAAWWILWR